MMVDVIITGIIAGIVFAGIGCLMVFALFLPPTP